MNTKLQIFLDNYVAKPAAFLLNFLARMIGQVLSINHDLSRNFKTIAICKFKGMGSIIQCTPMLAAIRNQYPDAEIIFVSTKSNKAILEKIDLIDTVLTVDDSGMFNFIRTNIGTLLTLIKKRPQVYFDLEIYSDYSSIFTLFTLSVNRIGFYLRSSSFRMGIYTHMMFFNPRVSISNVYLHLTQLIGCQPKHEGIYGLKSEQKGSEYSEKPYLVVNPNSSDLRLERRWDQNNFIELIQKILTAFPEYNVLLIGSKGEQSYTQEVADKINSDRVINTAGKTSIDEAIGIIENAQLMITNDTGPMHVGFSVKVPVICLFGPCSPDQYGMSENAHIIYKNAYCSPCVHDFEIAPCNGNNVCMKLIQVDEVFDKVVDVLDQEKSNINLKENSGIVFTRDENVLGIVNR